MSTVHPTLRLFLRCKIYF